MPSVCLFGYGGALLGDGQDGAPAPVAVEGIEIGIFLRAKESSYRYDSAWWSRRKPRRDALGERLRRRGCIVRPVSGALGPNTRRSTVRGLPQHVFCFPISVPLKKVCRRGCSSHRSARAVQAVDAPLNIELFSIQRFTIRESTATAKYQSQSMHAPKGLRAFFPHDATCARTLDGLKSKASGVTALQGQRKPPPSQSPA